MCASAIFGLSPPMKSSSRSESSCSISANESSANLTIRSRSSDPASPGITFTPPMPIIPCNSFLPSSTFVSANLEANNPVARLLQRRHTTLVLCCPLSFATAANPMLCSFALATISSNPPTQGTQCSPVVVLRQSSEPGTPPGVPCTAGVVPAGNASRNHFALSRPSTAYSSWGMPASWYRRPRRWQYAQNGTSGPTG